PPADSDGTDEPLDLLTDAGGTDPTSAKFCRSRAPPPIGVRNRRVQLFPDFLPPSDSASPAGTVTGSREMTCGPSPSEGKLYSPAESVITDWPLLRYSRTPGMGRSL